MPTRLDTHDVLACRLWCREPVSESESEPEDEEPGVRHGEEYQVCGVPAHTVYD